MGISTHQKLYKASILPAILGCNVLFVTTEEQHTFSKQKEKVLMAFCDLLPVTK